MNFSGAEESVYSYNRTLEEFKCLSSRTTCRGNRSYNRTLEEFKSVNPPVITSLYGLIIVP